MCNTHNPSTQLHLTNDSLNKINVRFYTPVKVHFLDTDTYGTEIIVSLIESGNYKVERLTRKI